MKIVMKTPRTCLSYRKRHQPAEFPEACSPSGQWMFVRSALLKELPCHKECLN